MINIGRWSEPRFASTVQSTPVAMSAVAKVTSGVDLPPVAGLNLVWLPSLRSTRPLATDHSSRAWPAPHSLWYGSHAVQWALKSPPTTVR